jgi:pSer/pThr/pTyr-binding forkhead associated (FHA) protein
LSSPQQFTSLIIRGLPPEVWSRRIKARKQVIGRAAECAIQLFDDRVSRQHAKIWERGGVAFIRDLKSRRGTFVDGERVERCTLLTGKLLRIGDITFQVITSQGTVQSDTFGSVSSTTIKHEIPLGVINTNSAVYPTASARCSACWSRALQRKRPRPPSGSAITPSTRT